MPEGNSHPLVLLVNYIWEGEFEEEVGSGDPISMPWLTDLKAELRLIRRVRKVIHG